MYLAHLDKVIMLRNDCFLYFPENVEFVNVKERQKNRKKISSYKLFVAENKRFDLVFSTSFFQLTIPSKTLSAGETFFFLGILYLEHLERFVPNVLHIDYIIVNWIAINDSIQFPI